MFLSAIDCGSYPYVDNAVVSTGATTYLSVTTVHCDEGYQISAGTQNTPSVCTAEGLWSPPNITCTGRPSVID